MSVNPSDALRELARSYGIQVDYVDMSGQTEAAPARSLLAVLRVLGADLIDESAAPLALRKRRLDTWRRRVEPVMVAWDGGPVIVEARIPARLISSTIRGTLRVEGGEIHDWSQVAGPSERVEVEGEEFTVVRLEVVGRLPTGYHTLSCRFDDGETCETLVISAPSRAFDPTVKAVEGKRPWGVFCPLYALHRESSWGAGDFSDLEALIDWTAGLGGGLVASLPMLASNFDGPSPLISPYSPTSRLFWNEFYLDLHRIPELARSNAARDLLADEETNRAVGDLKRSSLVEYGPQMRLKRAVLEILAEEIEATDDDRRRAFRAFVAGHPNVSSYAYFQAAGERHGRDWRSWPGSLAGPNDLSGVDPSAYRYHLYAQFLADEQLRSLAAKSLEKGLSWYVDFPVGVDFNSFDVWSHREAFATGASVGCPPDPVFTKGQNWGFPPLHPDRQRESGYAYLIASIRNHFKYANALRIDHVMGLHRLFWIPQGAEAKDGAFVSTPAEEIYAVLSVESHRHSAWLVGEDLGTVPPEVDSAMRRHNVRGMYVIQYEVRPDLERPLRQPPVSTVASVNTHDMPPFAAFWSGLDLDDRKDLGLLDDDRLVAERVVRADQRAAVLRFLKAGGFLAPDLDDTGSVLRATWDWLAASPSSVLLLNLEDLWHETESQNTPNTYDERPNWRRKLRRTFEQFANDPAIAKTLLRVDALRTRPVTDVVESA